MIAGIFKRGDGVRGGCVVRDLLQFEGTSRVEHEVDPVEKLLETVETAVQERAKRIAKEANATAC